MTFAEPPTTCDYCGTVFDWWNLGVFIEPLALCRECLALASGLAEAVMEDRVRMVEIGEEL